MVGDPVAVVAGRETLHHLVGELELAALLLRLVLEADREGQDVTGTRLGEQADQQARVETAGEQHADRDVGDAQPLVDRGNQRLAYRLGPLPLAQCVLGPLGR